MGTLWEFSDPSCTSHHVALMTSDTFCHCEGLQDGKGIGILWSYGILGCKPQNNQQPFLLRRFSGQANQQPTPPSFPVLTGCQCGMWSPFENWQLSKSRSPFAWSYLCDIFLKNYGAQKTSNTKMFDDHFGLEKMTGFIFVSIGISGSLEKTQHV